MDDPIAGDGAIGLTTGRDSDSRQCGTRCSGKVEIDTDYSTREGYNPNFLGGGKLRVLLPALTATQVKDAAVSSEPGSGAPYELQYHHYSVFMNRSKS